MKGVLLALFFLSIGPSLRAGDPVLFGVISENELSFQQCEYEKEAPAVILRYSGEIKLLRSKVYIKRLVRIKVLSEKGLDFADIRIPYYNFEQFEKVANVRAQTINTTRQGEPEFVKLDSDDFYHIDLTDGWKELRFTFPKVKPGSIIEYEYTEVSDNLIYLDDWVFQHEIPVLFSDLTVKIPSALRYQVMLRGNRLLKKYRDVNTNYWVLENLPSAKDEPFVFNKTDHLEKLKFQLVEYQLPHEYGVVEQKSLRKTWEELAGEVLESYRFRSYLNKTVTAREELKLIHLQGRNHKEKLADVYAHVARNYQWDGKYRRYTYQRFVDFHNGKEGNDAEINLFLCLLLNEAGIESYPVLLATRSKGQYVKEHPFLSQFNHVAVYATIDSEEFLLDATDSFRPFTLPAIESLVDEGFILKKSDPRWWTLPKPAPSSMYFDGKLDMENLSGDFNISLDEYLALEARRELFRNGKERWFSDHVPYYQHDKHSIPVVNNLLHPEEKLSFEGKVRLNPFANDRSDFVNIRPYVLDFLTDNPFVNNTRNFPVQFPFTQVLYYHVTIGIPDRFTLLRAPESERVYLPNQLGEFAYQVDTNYRTIEIDIRFEIRTLELPAIQYNNVRQFYSMISSKLHEEILFKRKN